MAIATATALPQNTVYSHVSFSPKTLLTMRGILRPNAKMIKYSLSRAIALILSKLETKFGIKQHKNIVHTKNIYIDKSILRIKA